MKPIIKLLSVILLAALIFVPAHPASAEGPTFDGQVVFGRSFTLASGESLDGDLLVFGGSADIEADAVVDGNIILFGGSLNVNGKVDGDVSVTGGEVVLGGDAHITGDLITVGATLERAESARVDGQIFNTATSWEASNGIEIPQIPDVPQTDLPGSNVHFNFNPFSAIGELFGQAFGLAILAMLVMLFLARNAERTARTAIAQPVTAAGLGLLTFLVAAIAFVTLALLSVLIVTIIVTVPLIIIVAIGLGMAVLFGWIALGYEIGRRLTRAMHQEWHPAFSAGLGTFLLALVANGASVLNFIPGMACFTWILPTLVSVVGLGAVVMSRFGTQEPDVPSGSVVLKADQEVPLPPTPDVENGTPKTE